VTNLAIDSSRRSANRSPRGSTIIEMIVLHATVGSAKSALDWLTSPASKVSTHYLIDNAGKVYQLVADDQVAWHAGRSSWHGVTKVNECSLGIELENANDGRDPYPAVQLEQCRLLCLDKIARYHIARGDVVRHLDIATPRGRKTDPAAFPWPAFADALYPHLSSPDAHYRVLNRATAGATIRDYPRTNARIRGVLEAGADWYGEPIAGQLVSVTGFGSSATWIRNLDQRVVWGGLLEKVRG